MTPVDESMLRLFFALWPDPPARAALAGLAREVAHHGHGRAPREANIHLTVVFLGDVPGAQVDALARIGEHVAKSVGAFDLALDRIGGRGYGLAWLAPPSLPEPLHTMHAALAGELAAGGFALERKMFRPHVTLARDCVRPAHRGRIAPIGWRVERLSLVASTLAQGGSQYRELAGWPLADA